ncbi:MAG: hypothetical protein SGJ11_18670 [Phycisphaerae bacterium]|nr:hypothetical protein [Phycisphaerae bacterium]
MNASGALILCALLCGGARAADPPPADIAQLRARLNEAANAAHAPVVALELLQALTVDRTPLGPDDCFRIVRCFNPTEPGEDTAARCTEFQDLLERGRRPIVGDDEATVALARAQSSRLALLTVICELRCDALLVPREQCDAAELEQLRAAVELLAPAVRPYVQLAIARRQLRIGVDASATIGIIRSNLGAPPLVRTAAEALEFMVARPRGDDTARAARTWAEGLRDAPSLVRLLAADTVACCAQPQGGPIDPGPWIELHASIVPLDRVALRPAFIERISSTVAPGSQSESGLVVAVLASNAPASDAERVAARLSQLAVRREDDPARPMVMYELGRALALLQKYDEAAVQFETLAREDAADPLAADGIDVALSIREERARLTSIDSEQTNAFRTILALAFDRFPRHPERHRWSLRAAMIENERGAPDEALKHLATIPAGAPERGEADLMKAEAAVRRGAGGGSFEAQLDAALAAFGQRQLAPPLVARRDLLLAERHRRAGEFERADVMARSVIVTPTAGVRTRARGLALLLQIRADRGGPVSLGPDEDALIRQQPEECWNALRPWLVPRCRTLREAGDAEAADDLLARIAPLLVHMAAGRATTADAIDLAQTMILARCSNAALALLRALDGSAQSTPDLRLLLAEALFSAGSEAQRSEAMQHYRALSASEPQGSPAWWQAELGQLRVASSVEGSVDREALLARINRLRAADPELGGPTIKQQFEAIATAARPAR